MLIYRQGKPCRADKIVLRITGAVAKGLINKPTTGKNPPADWRMTDKAVNNAVTVILFDMEY